MESPELIQSIFPSFRFFREGSQYINLSFTPVSIMRFPFISFNYSEFAEISTSDFDAFLYTYFAPQDHIFPLYIPCNYFSSGAFDIGVFGEGLSRHGSPGITGKDLLQIGNWLKKQEAVSRNKLTVLTMEGCKMCIGLVLFNLSRKQPRVRDEE